MATVSVQLDTDNLDEWRCPECGAVSYTMKAQGVLMLWCKEDHGVIELSSGGTAKRGVYMQRITSDAPAPEAAP